jgi:(p)ppGpp synthase/HD superfamily hydrolase
MKHYAQTIVQLLTQLCNNGYSKADLELVTSAYRLAAELFTGLYRPSGKTFISHLAGTASILCELHVSGELIATGLLHAAYEHGDFCTLMKGISPGKRSRLHRELGGEVENYVARYTALRWTETTIASIYEKFRTFDQIERDVLLVRLANELDDLSDLGVRYCNSSSLACQHYSRIAPLMIDMADQIGFPRLACELKEAVANIISADTFEELRSGYKGVRLIVPLSYSKRTWHRIGQRCSRALGKLRFAG